MATDGMDYLQRLRKRAEALIAASSQEAVQTSPEEIRLLAHDLAVHQVELEIQNEELQAAYQRIDAALAKYAQLYHQAPVGFLSLDGNGVILQCNQTFLDMLGEGTANLVGTSLASLLEPPGREVFLARYRAIFSNPEGKALDAKLRRKGKGLLDVRLTGRLEQNSPSGSAEERAATRLLMAVNDIGAEKAAEQAAQEAHRFNAQIIQSAGEGIIVYGPDRRYRLWNPFMEQLTGLPAGEVLGRLPQDVFPFLAAAGVIGRIERVLRGETVDSIDFPYQVPATGKSGWAADSSVPLRDGRGEIIGVIATVRDISERKAHERELERLNRLYDTLSHLSQSLVHVQSREGLLQEICTIAAEKGGFRLAWVGWVEPGARQVQPVAMAGEAAGYLDGLVVRLDDGPEGQGPMGICIREDRGYVCQDFALDARMFPWHAKASAFGLRSSATVPIHFQGRVTGALMIYAGEPGVFQEQEVALLDEVAATLSLGLEHLAALEERRQLEAQANRAQKMESLGVLASGVAHDMNNVLGAILGLASANLTTDPEETRIQSALTTIIKAAERGGKMVKGLLTFARATPAEELEVDFNIILQEAILLLERTTLAKVSLVTELADGLLLMKGDSSALSHAVMNLCINSVDALPAGGTLFLRTRNVNADWIEVLIEDTGCGMSEEVLAKAADPFFTTKEQGKGTGLGLTMAYATVKAHHGQMELQSKPGLGTLVTLRFPTFVASSPVASAEPEGPSLPAPEHLRVLLVDDDELIQRSVQMILEVLGHAAITTSSGEEALRRLESGVHADVVILDVNMPGLGGSGTLPRIRARFPDLPVLLATGRVDQATLDLLGAHARVTLLPKPFSLGQLKLGLARAMQG